MKFLIPFLILQIAAEVAGPLSECNKIVLVSNNGEIGAGKLTNEVMDVITKINSNVTSLINSTTTAAINAAATTSTSTTVGIEIISMIYDNRIQLFFSRNFINLEVFSIKNLKHRGKFFFIK